MACSPSCLSEGGTNAENMLGNLAKAVSATSGANLTFGTLGSPPSNDGIGVGGSEEWFRIGLVIGEVAIDRGLGVVDYWF